MNTPSNDPTRNALHYIGPTYEADTDDAADTERPMTLAIFSDDGGQPTVKDTDLASYLGFDRPINIRTLIKTHTADLPGIRHVFTTKTYESRPGVVQERKALEYHLDEPSALFIAARTDAPKGKAILKMLINCFVAYRTGKLTPAPHALDMSLIHGLLASQADSNRNQADTNRNMTSLLTFMIEDRKAAKPATAPAPVAVAPVTDYTASKVKVPAKPKYRTNDDVEDDGVRRLTIAQWDCHAFQGTSRAPLSYMQRGSFSQRVAILAKSQGIEIRHGKPWNGNPGPNVYPVDVINEAWSKYSYLFTK